MYGQEHKTEWDNRVRTDWYLCSEKGSKDQRLPGRTKINHKNHKKAILDLERVRRKNHLTLPSKLGRSTRT